MPNNNLRVPVLIDRELYDEFKTYSDLTGVPVSRLVRDAMKDYNEVTLAARLEALTSSTVCTLPDERDGPNLNIHLMSLTQSNS